MRLSSKEIVGIKAHIISRIDVQMPGIALSFALFFWQVPGNKALVDFTSMTALPIVGPPFLTLKKVACLGAIGATFRTKTREHLVQLCLI